MKSLYALFFLALVCYGLNAGVGFANVVGMLPDFQTFSESTYVEAHQDIDRYFAARYPVFGNFTVLLTLIVLGMLYKNRQWRGFRWTLAALAFFSQRHRDNGLFSGTSLKILWRLSQCKP